MPSPFQVNTLVELPQVTLQRCVDAVRSHTLPESETGGTARLARELVRGEQSDVHNAPAGSASGPGSRLALAVAGWGRKESVAEDEPPSARLACELTHAVRGTPFRPATGTAALARAVVRLVGNGADPVAAAVPGSAQLAVELAQYVRGLSTQ